MNDSNNAVGTQPDPGAAPKRPRHAPATIALVVLGIISALAVLLIFVAWL